ncbi:MAG: DUF898 family protein, partial [Planctomycetota bacterium]|nr:DUF898 family protein [Planctomycetota bacterium]
YSMPCRFKFIGTGGALFAELGITFVLLIITFGLYGPWFVCRFQKWWTQKIKLGFSNGKKVSFDFQGKGGEFFVTYLVGYLLTAVTLGLYGPFFVVNQLKFFINHTAGKTGDGRTVHLSFGGSGGELFVNVVLGILLTLITFGFYFPWFYCSLIRWGLNNTKVNVQGHGALQPSFEGRGGQLLGTFVVGYILSVVTLGLYSFWLQVDLFKFLYGNTKVTSPSRQRYSGDFSGTGGENLMVTLKGMILCCVTLGIYVFWFVVEQSKFQLDNIDVAHDRS